MLPELDRGLLLGGLLALLSGFYLLRWGWQFLRAAWRRLNVRRGLPYLRHSLSSYGVLSVLGLAGLALGVFVVFADLTMRRSGRLEGDVAEVGRLQVSVSGGRVILTLDPSAGTPLPSARVELPGERWRIHGTIVQFSGLWRFLGIPDGYRTADAETAAGPIGRPDAWIRESGPLVAADPWFDVLKTLAGRLPGVRLTPHATDWEPARPDEVTLLVTPAGYAFLPAEDTRSGGPGH